MKTVRTLNITTGIVTLAYLVVTVLTMVMAIGAAAEIGYSSYEASNISDAATGGLLATGLFGIFTGLLAIALLVLGVITIVLNGKLDKNINGRTLGLVASIMCTAGMVVGWIPWLNYIYIIATAVLYFVSASQLKKSEQQQL